MINIEENFNELINLTKAENDSGKLCEFLKSTIEIKFKKYFNYVRLFYEKALEVNPDDDNIWTQYVECTKLLNKNSQLTLNILSRATKCCYFNVVLWVLMLREMESVGTPLEEIQSRINQAYTSAEDEKFLSEIWKYCLEFHCRNFYQSEEQLINLRSLFENAISDIETKGEKDYVIKILSIWAEFEVYKVRDYYNMYEIMNRIVKTDSSAENWKTFINYEKYFGNPETIRKIYKRAVEYSKEDKVFL